MKQTKIKYPLVGDFDDSKFQDSRGVLFVIDEWLKRGGVSNDETKKIITEIKNTIFENLKPSDIKDSYYDFMSALVKQLA